jgi:hypothetical protein
MNVEQARAKLNSVNKFTAGGGADIPIIISELCDVVEFLLDKIERIKSPPMTTLETTSEPLDSNEVCPIDPLDYPCDCGREHRSRR